MHACYLMFSGVAKIKILIASLILSCSMSQFVVLRLKWSCVGIDLNVDDKDNVTLLGFIIE